MLYYGAAWIVYGMFERELGVIVSMEQSAIMVIFVVVKAS